GRHLHGGTRRRRGKNPLPAPGAPGSPGRDDEAQAGPGSEGNPQSGQKVAAPISRLKERGAALVSTRHPVSFAVEREKKRRPGIGGQIGDAFEGAGRRRGPKFSCHPPQGTRKRRNGPPPRFLRTTPPPIRR